MSIHSKLMDMASIRDVFASCPQPLLDKAFVIETLGGDELLIKTLLSQYLLSSPAYEQALRTAIASEDWEAIASAAHSLLNSVIYFGSRYLEEKIIDLECAALHVAMKRNNGQYADERAGVYVSLFSGAIIKLISALNIEIEQWLALIKNDREIF
ncbi:Hpt domain-containing protein [Aeromonas enteropelogenes]|uniref:Hpt domain-containing protein n=1 Tax=Aeromonas enteropelogenes TaxID=29489 RepID=UPI003B9EA592